MINDIWVIKKYIKLSWGESFTHAIDHKYIQRFMGANNSEASYIMTYTAA